MVFSQPFFCSSTAAVYVNSLHFVMKSSRAARNSNNITRAMKGRLACTLFLIIVLAIHDSSCAAPASGLQAGFYSSSCPDLETIVYSNMEEAVDQEPRMAASLLRLFFHDCLVQGCDASILLDDTPTFQGEKNADPNVNSARGFELIDSIKAEVENACEGVVSCADILALAARDGVALSGGPSWTVLLGRRDARTASFKEANTVIPSPFLDVNDLAAVFESHGFSLQDMVTLSGAHTFGEARCLFFRVRLYNMTGDGKPDSTINPYYLRRLQNQCPQNQGDNNLSPLDPYSPNYFDNRYFLNLIYGRGLFISDQVLYSAAGSPTVQLVRSYSQNPSLFFSNFATSMIKLGNLNPLTGGSGEIRRNCRMIN